MSKAFLIFVFVFLLSSSSGYAQTYNNLGDVDRNLVVDIFDFNEVVGFFGRVQTNPYLDADLDKSGKVDIFDFNEVVSNFGKTYTTSSPSPTGTTGMSSESMAMQNWQAGGKNAPNPLYDKCTDGTDVSLAHKQYYVIAYDGKKYPTWHPPVVTNPIPKNPSNPGTCTFGHEHGSDPQKYLYWNEIVQHFGKDQNADGTITPMVINVSTGAITPGDRAGIPFGIANEHMELYYNQGGVDSIFVRHEDHVGHKIEFVNKETDINTTIDGNVTASTNEMTQLAGTNGLNVPYYNSAGDQTYQPTGVVCTHLHKFHQGTHSGDAIRNNLHEVIFHSTCQSVDVNGINAPAYYPNNTVLLTGMMAFGNPGEYLRFCFADRFTKVCPDGKNADGSCVINDPLLSKMPNAINSTALGRNMVDKYCLQNFSSLNPGQEHFGPYEIWEGDLAIFKGDTLTNSSTIAEHGRQWDVLDPVRFVDVGYVHPDTVNRPWQKDYQFNSENCAAGGAFDGIKYISGCYSRTSNTAWDSPNSGFKGLKRTTYFGRNHVNNQGGSLYWWTNPLGGNAIAGTNTIPTTFQSGLKQRISTVAADIQKVQSRIQQYYNNTSLFLNDRALQRDFNRNNGANTIHAPN